jgi:hypothetical protein
MNVTARPTSGHIRTAAALVPQAAGGDPRRPWFAARKPRAPERGADVPAGREGLDRGVDS